MVLGSGDVGRPGDEPRDEPGEAALDPRQPLAHLLWSLHTSRQGLGDREAARRLVADGPNELARRGAPRWPGELSAQLTHPLALLLLAAAVLSAVNGSTRLAVAIAVVIVLNALVAFVQELQAERAVEALAAYLPERARVRRDGVVKEVEARSLVPGDLLVIGEGDRICADARLVEGAVEVDLSTLSGEAEPAERAAEWGDVSGPLIEARNLVFSGTSCTGGEALAVVTRTGMRTELGRIAALSERAGRESSPLERQVKRVARLIGLVAVGAAVAFLPLGAAAGLSVGAAVSFSAGLLVANVPEGLLPTITLALAVGVRDLARAGAVVKRLSAVETLGATTVVCTDKTGTLTENRMQPVLAWTPLGDVDLAGSAPSGSPGAVALVVDLVGVAAACTTAAGAGSGDPTEVALVDLASRLGTGGDPAARDGARRVLFRFDPHLRRMSTIDETPGGLAVHTKGAPESVLGCCTALAGTSGPEPLGGPGDAEVRVAVERLARRGLRVLAVAGRNFEGTLAPPGPSRAEAESGLCLLGLVGLLDPPRPEVADAVDRAHRAGIRIHVVTGDNGLTAAEVARQVGIGGGEASIVNGDELEALPEAELDALLSGPGEVVFARSSPEAKLRIVDALRDLGEVVAVTGDGVNDAPALRRADIGVAMGASGTDVAREAATMVLTDDDFATIVSAVEEGRRVFDNVRRFIVYIFSHTVPEVLPFLVFALSGGAVPLPLTVMEILAVDLGTDTLPALALSREPAEAGVMDRPPRDPSEGVIRPAMLARSWGFIGALSSLLVLGAYLSVLLGAGWRPGEATGPGTGLHHAYVQATTLAFVAIVACQVGTAFAVRTELAPVWRSRPLANRPLLVAIGFALGFAAALVYAPPLEDLFGTAALGPGQVARLAPLPVAVLGADELRKALRRRRAARAGRPRGEGPFTTPPAGRSLDSSAGEPDAAGDGAGRQVPEEVAEMRAAVGDKIVIEGHHVGEHKREAEILAVEGPEGGPPYRVRWGDDGHEGLFFPGSDASVVHYPVPSDGS